MALRCMMERGHGWFMVSRLLLCPIFLTRDQRDLDPKTLTSTCLRAYLPLTYQQPMAFTHTSTARGTRVAIA